MADEAAPAVAEPQAPLSEPISESLTGSQLDAILNQMRPMPSTASPPPPAPVAPAPQPKTEAEQWTDAEPEPAPEPPNPAESPKPAPPSSPFDPPPSVLGEIPVEPAAPASVEEEFGTVPEKPARGFKSKEEEANWGKVRASHEKALAEVARLRGEIKSKPPVDENMKAQMDDLIARNEQLNAIVERRAIQDHPYVVEHFDNPRKQAFATAQKALERVGIDPNELSKALSLTGEARVEATDALYEQIQSPTTRERVNFAIAEIEKFEDLKADFIANRQDNNEKLTQAEKAERYRQMAQQEQALDQSVESAVDQLANKMGFSHWRLSKDPNAGEWNSRIEARKKALTYLVKENKDPEVLVRVLAAGTVAEDIKNWATSLQERLQTATQKLAEYEGTMPSLNGDSPHEAGSSKGTIAKDDDEMAAAGILPTDSLAVQSRKLANYWANRG